MLCEYGCEKEATHQFKNGKWCCSKSHNSCPSLKKINSKINKGRVVCQSTRRKISDTLKEKFTGKNNPNWKGGYRNIPLYDTYHHQLFFPIEECKRNEKDSNILDVKCSVCENFFTPTFNAVINRIAALNGIQGGEHKFYCSKKCKDKCSVYGKKIYQENHPKKENELYTQEEYQTFREYALERDNYKCQYCDEAAEHVHHERPQKLEPFFALDPDLAWSMCKKCHYEKGHTKGSECSTGKLASKIC